MSMGQGSIYSKSTKQKINTRSSTEAELVGINDAMSMILWTRLFLEAQGVEVSDNIVYQYVYQDNQSTMLLAKNGRHLSGKSTRHLEIRYYFVTDNIRHNRLSLEYCPTEEMIRDFFTKPLQGALFYKLWSLIMNLKSDESVVSMEAERTTSLIKAKECVGSSVSSDRSVRHPVHHPGTSFSLFLIN